MIKILGMHFSYNEKLAKSMNFVETVNQVEKLLGVWSQMYWAVYNTGLHSLKLSCTKKLFFLNALPPTLPVCRIHVRNPQLSLIPM